MLQLRLYQQEVIDKLKTSLKSSNHPLLLTMSVGSGKSVVIAEILKWIESFGYRALCLTLNSTLIKQNADAYKLQGGNGGIYCAGLDAKEFEKPIIFGSPHSVCKDIKEKKEISSQPFNLIIVDECHNISPHDNSSMYMRIFNHYRHLALEGQYSFRIIGLTGTPFRGKGESIVGEHAFFKEEICNIDASYLIKEGYLSKPKFNEIDEHYDFSNLRIKSNGRFDEKQLSEIVNSNERLTHKIMHQVRQVVESGRSGAFVFCSTRKHCLEAIKALPEGLAYIITGETPIKERERILSLARLGQVKYLLTVNCLLVGVDVPNFDTVAWLRPTESLVMYIQGIGRGLRLSPGKDSCLILDYAGNLDRHGDIDDQIINEALRPSSDDDPDYCIPCYRCNTNNKVTSRRCIGKVENKRCDYYFIFKECPGCGIENDQVSRECRGCGRELIDPNAKLSELNPVKTYEVELMSITPGETFYINYLTKDGFVTETYYLSSTKALNYFYGNFVRKHLEKPSKYYPHLSKPDSWAALARYAIKPRYIKGQWNDGEFKIKSKEF